MLSACLIKKLLLHSMFSNKNINLCYHCKAIILLWIQKCTSPVLVMRFYIYRVLYWLFLTIQCDQYVCFHRDLLSFCRLNALTTILFVYLLNVNGAYKSVSCIGVRSGNPCIYSGICMANKRLMRWPKLRENTKSMWKQRENKSPVGTIIKMLNNNDQFV